jgi:hypothetical protein
MANARDSEAPTTTVAASSQQTAAASQNPATPTTGLGNDDSVVQSLKDALTAAGISVEGLGLTAHTDVVTYPGGSYINRYISVNAHGHEEGLMTNLVAIDPKVAVVDVKNMLAHA